MIMDTLVVCEDNLEKVVKNLNLKICIIASPYSLGKLIEWKLDRDAHLVKTSVVRVHQVPTR